MLFVLAALIPASSAVPPLTAPTAAAPTASAGTWRLPQPSGAPMSIDFSHDPILRFGDEAVPSGPFRTMVAGAVERHPALRQAEAGAQEARYAVGEARADLFPTLDINVTGDRSLSRRFGNDPGNVLERIQPHGRTDASATFTQTLFDFGATLRRLAAARAQRDSAEADIRSAGDEVALRAVSAWYDVAAYRALVAMAGELAVSQANLRGAVGERIAQGVASEGDLARVDTYVASAVARQARFARSLGEAEARFREAFGVAPPATIARPALDLPLPPDEETARAASERSPQVVAAEADERAARQTWLAVGAENLPRIQGVIDAGRYGVFETAHDYDVRGRLVFRHRLFGGGGGARQGQARERYVATQARADAVRETAARDSAIAFADLASARAEVVALEAAYVANRRSRDVLAERFRVARGQLIDVLVAEDNYFDVATSYVQAVADRDAEQLVLLQRDGALLDALGVRLTGGRK